MNTTCPRCGNNNIQSIVIDKDQTIYTSWAKSKGKPFENVLRYIEYDYFYRVVAKKEHNYIICNRCGYRDRQIIKKAEDV